ncbi:NAD(P)/FAD-dependent oxidoreductase [Janthinobacterium fluminis]
MHYDTIVIGGSFAGLSAAMQLARARRRVLVVDAGRPRNRYASHSHGFFGQDGKAPQEIAALGRRQLAAYPTVSFLDGEVQTARQADGGFVASLADGREARAARLILAIGVSDALPPIPGMQERWGATVLHCPYCHGYEIGDRPLGVLANAPASLHQALLLPDWGPTTYFTQARHEPDAQQLASLQARGVRIERTPVVALLGEAPTLHAVGLADGRIVPVYALFTAPKTSLASPLARQLGCAVEAGPLGPFIKVDERQQSSVKGVYAAGDAASPMSNATLAAAAGVLAGMAAHRSLIGM